MLIFLFFGLDMLTPRKPIPIPPLTIPFRGRWQLEPIWLEPSGGGELHHGGLQSSPVGWVWFGSVLFDTIRCSFTRTKPPTTLGPKTGVREPRRQGRVDEEGEEFLIWQVDVYHLGSHDLE